MNKFFKIRNDDPQWEPNRQPQRTIEPETDPGQDQPRIPFKIPSRELRPKG